MFEVLQEAFPFWWKKKKKQNTQRNEFSACFSGLMFIFYFSQFSRIPIALESSAVQLFLRCPESPFWPSSTCKEPKRKMEETLFTEAAEPEQGGMVSDWQKVGLY